MAHKPLPTPRCPHACQATLLATCCAHPPTLPLTGWLPELEQNHLGSANHSDLQPQVFSWLIAAPPPWPWEQLPPLRFQAPLPLWEGTKEKIWGRRIGGGKGEERVSRNEGRGEARRRQWASSHKPCLMPNPDPSSGAPGCAIPLDSILPPENSGGGLHSPFQRS